MTGWQVTIRGIDVNPAAIAKGKNGRYSAWSLREIDPELSRIVISFRKGATSNSTTRFASMVSLEEGNLMDAQAPFWKPNAYDVIFFRNAFMYLSAEAGQAVVARMAESLAPGGYLFMGPAETLRGISHDFHLCHTHGTFYYQLRTGRAGAAIDSRSLTGARRRSCDGRAAVGAEILAPETESDWADTIRQATERIRMLTRAPEPSRAANAKACRSRRTPRASLPI